MSIGRNSRNPKVDPGEVTLEQPAEAAEEPRIEAESEQTTSAASEAAADEVESPAMGELQAQLEQALEEIEQYKERFLRAKAEVENTRRRATNDVANAHKYAVERFAGEMLGVKDSLELARSVELTGDNKEALERMLEGLELTLKLMSGVFKKFSLEAIDPAKGEKFDPDKHQAMTVQESDEVGPNEVLAVVQKGYQLHDRLLRPAMVIVAKAVEQQSEES